MSLDAAREELTAAKEEYQNYVVALREAQEKGLTQAVTDALEQGKNAAQEKLNRLVTRNARLEMEEHERQLAARAGPADQGVESDDYQRQTFDPADFGFVDEDFPEWFEPRPNVLSQFSSHSYSISIYILTHEEANLSEKGIIPPLRPDHLLIQTGGAKVGERNEFFDHDFAIDNIELSNVVGAAGSASAAFPTNIKFIITEPYGLTLIDRLRAASKKVNGEEASYLEQRYLMVIRFYGYDKQGNLITPRDPSAVSDRAAVLEKTIPFRFINVTFRLSTGIATYECTATPFWNFAGLGDITGVIQETVELAAPTVGEILGAEMISGAGIQSTVTHSKTGGLVDAINRQLRKAEPGTSIADEIQILIADGFNIESATLKKPGYLSKQKTTPVQSSNPRDQALDETNSVAVDERIYSFAAGTPIVSIIDTVMQSSSYITRQQTVVIAEDGRVTQNPIPEQDTFWYNIRISAETMGDFDTKLNRHPYRIVYSIHPYRVKFRNPSFFSQGKFRGVHKRYAYWFTGQNTEVINYEQHYQSAFYLPAFPEDYIQSHRKAISAAERTPHYYRRSSGENVFGGLNDNTLPAGDVAAYLYNPGDIAKSTLEILGDPDWIGTVSAAHTPDYKPFLKNGDINYHASEAEYEVTFNLPVDYDLQSGTMDPTKNNYHRKDGVNLSEPAVSFVFRAYSVLNVFKSGKFTQTIEGTLTVNSEEFLETMKNRDGDSGDLPDARGTSGTDLRSGDTALTRREAGAMSDADAAMNNAILSELNENPNTQTGTSVNALNGGFNVDQLSISP